MNAELQNLSEQFIDNANRRLEEVYHSRSNHPNQITRMAENLELWKNYLVNEANPEANKFVEEVNSAKYDHISEAEKLEVNDTHREKLKDLILSYNRKVVLNEQ